MIGAAALGYALHLEEVTRKPQAIAFLREHGPIREVWWHLPAAVAIMLGVLQMARLLDYRRSHQGQGPADHGGNKIKAACLDDHLMSWLVVTLNSRKSEYVAWPVRIWRVAESS